MTDPNLTYKSTFARLTSQLGRVPTSRDREWLEMHEEYKRAWAPAVESTAPQARRTSGSDAAGRPVPTEDDVHTREAEEATGGPGINADGERAGTAPDAGNGQPPVLQTGRGPNGGVLATCGKCGRVWEREKRRGRPSLVCGECR